MRNGLRSFAGGLVTVLSAWVALSLVSLLWLMAWPRTATGYLLALTAVPLVFGVLYATAELLGGVLWRVKGIERFHRRIEERTREERTSALRIGVALVEVLVFGGIALLAMLALVRVLGLDPVFDHLEAFMLRHFWSIGGNR